MHESQAVLSMRQEDITATVVKYIPQTQSLCVGYNMQGAFQMFSLKTLDLDFSGFASGLLQFQTQSNVILYKSRDFRLQH